MRAWVFARRARARDADRFAESLREQGHSVARANSRFYEGEVYRDADVLYHDGGNARLVYVHEKAGITCEYVDFGAYGQPAVVEQEAGPAYVLEENRPWFTIYDREGNKVGKATRNEDEAKERLAELMGGG